MTISIITACFNNLSTIECCRQSVRAQSRAAEHIFVDGCSRDGTREWLKGDANADPSILYISEPDKGIYDAMNKGFKMSSGDIVGTLNADDYYADNQVLERVAKVMADTRIDACYGDLVFVQSHRDQFEDRIVRFWRAGNQGQVWSADTSSRSVFSNPWLWGWMPPHPTLFIRRHILETLGVFRLDMGTAADFELMLRLLNKHRIRCAYIPEVLVKMRVGGVSTRSITNRLKAHLNDWKAWRINGLIPFPWTVPLKPLRKIGQWTSD